MSSPGNKSCKTGNTLFIEVKIGKRRCPALLDTGSEVTLLPKHLADLSQLNRSSRTLRAANGTLINIVGEWKTVVTIGPVSVTMNFIVSDQIDELLVGIDWMRDNGCVISFAELTLELQGYRFPLLTKTKPESCNRVVANRTVSLQDERALPSLREVKSVTVEEGTMRDNASKRACDTRLRQIPNLRYKNLKSQRNRSSIVHDIKCKSCPVLKTVRSQGTVNMNCVCMLLEPSMEPSTISVRPFACDSCP